MNLIGYTIAAEKL